MRSSLAQFFRKSAKSDKQVFKFFSSFSSDGFRYQYDWKYRQEQEDNERANKRPRFFYPVTIFSISASALSLFLDYMNLESDYLERTITRAESMDPLERKKSYRIMMSLASESPAGAQKIIESHNGVKCLLQGLENPFDDAESKQACLLALNFVAQLELGAKQILQSGFLVKTLKSVRSDVGSTIVCMDLVTSIFSNPAMHSMIINETDCLSQIAKLALTDDEIDRSTALLCAACLVVNPANIEPMRNHPFLSQSIAQIAKKSKIKNENEKNIFENENENNENILIDPDLKFSDPWQEINAKVILQKMENGSLDQSELKVNTLASVGSSRYRYMTTNESAMFGIAVTGVSYLYLMLRWRMNKFPLALCNRRALLGGLGVGLAESLDHYVTSKTRNKDFVKRQNEWLNARANNLPFKGHSPIHDHVINTAFSYIFLDSFAFIFLLRTAKYVITPTILAQMLAGIYMDKSEWIEISKAFGIGQSKHAMANQEEEEEEGEDGDDDE